MGGAWERMMRSVRRILTSLTADRTLDDDQLHTFLLEAEAILNSRPLTPITIDPERVEPLTPHHLLKLHPTRNLPPAITDGKDCYTKRRWRHVQFLADRFWSRCSKEYLRIIISRQKWLNEKPNFNVSDIVLLITDNAPRSHRNIGKICAIEPDEQEIVLHQSTAASTWWCGPRPRLDWVEMAVGLPEGPTYPGHSPFIFSLCCSLNDRRRAAHSFFKIGRLFSFFSCPSLALLRLIILLLLLMSGNVHPNPGPIFPCSVCAGNVTWRGKSVQCCACSKWVHLRCSQLSLSKFRALGSSHSWSCPHAESL